MVKQKNNKSAPVKKKAASKKKVALKKKVPAKKRAVKKKVPQKKRTVKKRTAKKKAAPKNNASGIKSLSLLKDGSEGGQTSDELFKRINGGAGRPSKYSITLGKKICLLLSMGFSLNKICSYVDMPVVSTVCKWLLEEDKQEFSEWYSRAREIQPDLVEDTFLDIVEESGKVPFYNPDGLRVRGEDGEFLMVHHPANVSHTKIKSDAHHKYLQSLKKSKWGNSVDLGNNTIDLLHMMDLAAGRIQAMDRKPATIDNESGTVIK